MKKNSRKSRKINRYYVGASHIAGSIENGSNAEWTHPTIEEAVKHGKRLMEEEDKDTIVIVQIVKILRRAPNPITVETLR